MSSGPHISWCRLTGLWLSVWERSGVHVSWDYRSFNRFALLFSFFQLFSSSTNGVLSLFPLLQNKYLHLTLSASWWVFQRALMIGPLFWAQLSMSNSVRPCRLPLGGSQFGLVTRHPFLRLFSIFVPAFLSDSNSSGSEFFTVGWQPHPSTWCPLFLLEVGSTSSLPWL